MRELIFIHVGQAGVQIGDACWTQFASNLGIAPDGTVTAAVPGAQVWFQEVAKGYTSRSLFLDLEPTPVDVIRQGHYRKLHPPKSLIAGKEDAASNFSRGHFTIGKEVIDIALEQIRKMSEACSTLGGMILTRSTDGGTGSGVGSLLIPVCLHTLAWKLHPCFGIIYAPDI